MRYASVCSGVEAASLAWEYLGWEPVFFSEIEPFPCAVLKERFPNVPNLGDMTKITKKGDVITNGTNDIQLHGRGIDLLVGGTPCQGFSVAGRQGGLNDDRSVLALTYIRLLEELRPKWFVWENVPGVFSTNGGGDIKRFIHEITKLGYSCAWRVLDAQYVRVDGFPRAVPQRRRRVFVVGHIGSEWEYPASALFEPDCLQGDSPPRRIKGKGFTTLAERSIGATGIDEYSRVIRMRAGNPGNCKGALVSEELSLTLGTGNDQTLIRTSGRLWDDSGVNQTLNQCNAGCGTIGASNQELFSQNFNGLVAEGTLRANTHGNEQIVCYDNQTRARNPLPTGDVSGTLQAYMGTGGGNVPLVHCYENHAQDSRIKELNGVCSQICAKAGTGGNNLPLVQECYAIDAKSSNSMKSDNPNSGFHKEEIAKTLDSRVPNAYSNQGGNVIVESRSAIAFEPGIAKREGSDSRFTVEFTDTLRGNAGDNLPCVTTIGSKCNPSTKVRLNVDAYECPKTVDTSGKNAVCIPINSMVLGKDKYKEGDRQCLGIGNDGDPCFTLQANHHHAIAIAENTIGRLPENGGNGNGFSEELAYTQNATGVMGVAYDLTIRRLLPVECERLMGFPDNWTRIPWKGKPEEECPDGHRYKACGNSMCVNVMRWIGMRIELVERKTRNA